MIVNDQVNYVFHLWFKILRYSRLKHRLSINTLLVLNGAYLHSKLINPSFSKTSLAKFITYYNLPNISKYITVLRIKGLVIPSGMYKQHCQLYQLTEYGINVITEIQNNYNKVYNKFCIDNGISV